MLLFSKLEKFSVIFLNQPLLKAFFSENLGRTIIPTFVSASPCRHLKPCSVQVDLPTFGLKHKGILD